MAGESLRCVIGMHTFVREHLSDECLQGPDKQVCRPCGEHRDVQLSVAPGAFGSGGVVGGDRRTGLPTLIGRAVNP
jgi:hypothetical protein